MVAPVAPPLGLVALLVIVALTTTPVGQFTCQEAGVLAGVGLQMSPLVVAKAAVLVAANQPPQAEAGLAVLDVAEPPVKDSV